MFLNSERNLTFIIVAHDPGIAQRTRRVIRLNDGRIESDTRALPPVAAVI